MFYVLEENAPIVEWFLETEDLYIYNQSVCIGLDVKAVQSDAVMSNRKVKKHHYQGLRIMGRAFANELNKQLERQAKR